MCKGVIPGVEGRVEGGGGVGVGGIENYSLPLGSFGVRASDLSPSSPSIIYYRLVCRVRDGTYIYSRNRCKRTLTNSLSQLKHDHPNRLTLSIGARDSEPRFNRRLHLTLNGMTVFAIAQRMAQLPLRRGGRGGGGRGDALVPIPAHEMPNELLIAVADRSEKTLHFSEEELRCNFKIWMFEIIGGYL